MAELHAQCSVGWLRKILIFTLSRDATLEDILSDTFVVTRMIVGVKQHGTPSISKVRTNLVRGTCASMGEVNCCEEARA